MLGLTFAEQPRQSQCLSHSTPSHFTLCTQCAHTVHCHSVCWLNLVCSTVGTDLCWAKPMSRYIACTYVCACLLLVYCAKMSVHVLTHTYILYSFVFSRTPRHHTSHCCSNDTSYPFSLANRNLGLAVHPLIFAHLLVTVTLNSLPTHPQLLPSLCSNCLLYTSPSPRDS